MRISKRKIIIGIIILILISVGGFLYYKSKSVFQAKKVEIEKVKVISTVSGSGEVKSRNQRDLSFSATGIIQTVNINEGAFVKKGQLLASLNAYSAGKTAQSAKDSRDIAIRDKDIFIEQYADNPDAIGGKEEYEIRLRRYNELISQAESTYQAQTGTLKNYYIYAPFGGTVTDVLGNEGEIATASTTVIKLADLTNLYFEMSVDQEDFGSIRSSQHAELELDAYPDEIFQGTISSVPAYAKDTNEDFTVEISLNNKENNVLLGMTGDARVTISETLNEVSALSFDAVFEDLNLGDYIWILEDGKLKKLPVETGLKGDIETEIKTDISSYTIVIPIDNKAQFQEGQKAKINE